MGLGFIGAGDQVSGDAIGGQQVANLDGTHAAALSGHPRIRLEAGSSRDAGRRERFAQRCGARTYPDWREMLGRERPEIVSVATYAPQHAQITIAAVEQGARVVYCEKPIATSVAEARRMVEACAAAGALLVVNHNRRFNPNYRRLRDWVGAGGLGELTSASLRWGGGRLGNVGTHLIDALMMVSGRRVRGVSGLLDPTGRADCRGPQFRDPGAWGLLRLEGGLVATLDAPDRGRTPVSLELSGTAGRATTGREEVIVEYWDGRNERWPSLRPEATSMDRAVGEIVDWLDRGAPFPYAAQDAVRTLEAITALHLSHERGSAFVDLPLPGEDCGRVLGTA